MSFLAIDADIMLYQAASSAEHEIDWGGDLHTLHTNLKEAKDIFMAQLEQVVSDTGVKKAVFCLSDHHHNFRKDVFPDYKSGRKKTRKPTGYLKLVQWLEDNHTSVRKPSIEADDICGILATKTDNIGKCIIVSNDKDLMTIPGQLYRPMNKEMLSISEEDADRYFLTQVLTGDATDSYKGVPGVGPKKAETILGQRPSWGAVEQAYIKAGMTRDDAIQQARLARILRWSDWDEEKGEVILWTPKQ